MRVVTFQVHGLPQPKGSAKAFTPASWARRAIAAGQSAVRAVVTNDNPKAKGWQQLVAEQAQGVAGDGLFVGPVTVTLVFRLPRPVSLPKRVEHHLTTPDLDKLVRCALDGLTHVLFADDKAVVELRARKVYAVAPGAEITVAACGTPNVTQSSFDLFREEVQA
jgi:Holliday junction resolvase RusA-like endonuclease